MADVSAFTVDERGIQAILSSPGGPVHRDMERRAKRIVFLARKLVGKDTRRLQRSISYRLVRAGDAVVAEVTADTSYALMHHNGTRPHLIVPNSQRVLRFKQGGRVVYARKVMHPGTRPNPYLVTALREVMK